MARHEAILVGVPRRDTGAVAGLVVAVLGIIGEPLATTGVPAVLDGCAAGRGSVDVVVVLIVVVVHWSHAEVGLDLVQRAHRVTFRAWAKWSSVVRSVSTAVLQM
ncbi:Uncharacterised protein [Mycobacteroides abscessus subsp. abscessus]|nr:Uncharacterised protein [Mycobacteroides abscessus subsp. abscessus]